MCADDRLPPATGPGSTQQGCLVVLLIGSILFVFAVVYVIPTWCRGEDPPKTHRSQMQACRMAQAMEIYRLSWGDFPYQADGEADYENAGIVRQLQSLPDCEIQPPQLNAKGSFVDSWRQPFRVVIWKEKPTDAFNRCFRVYSCGPNMRWDYGHKRSYKDKNGKTVTGDDIASD